MVWALGDWAMEWLLGDPAKEHHDGRHLLWRMSQRVVDDELSAERTVVQFDLRGAHRGRREWLLLDPQGTSVCERDEGFEVDLWVDADIRELLRVWMGRSSWWKAMGAGDIVFHGPKRLVREFPRWFALSPFAGRG